MRFIPIQKVTEGMICGQAVYDAAGRALIRAGMALSTTYINGLIKNGIGGLYIDDEFSKGIEVTSVITPELRMEAMNCVQRADVDACVDTAKLIVEQILSSGSLSLDLQDMRTLDNFTFAHSVNVAVISTIIGMGLKFSPDELEYMAIIGLLHDLGKLEVPPEILNKPGRLTKEEYDIMKSHSTRSYELIKDRWDLSAFVKTAVLYHHENVDGTGYPNGIIGEDQTIYTKVIHVADVYDALISKRPYKEPYSSFEAAEYLMGGCGLLFDQECVQTLLKYVPLYPKGTEIMLSDGRLAIIVENSGEHSMRPIVRIEETSEQIDLSDRENYSLTIFQGGENGLRSELSDDEENADQEPNKPAKQKILIVDDTPMNLQNFKHHLSDEYDLILCKSAKQALKYLDIMDAPDLCLLDIEMPGMNGIELAEEIRKITWVPIAFVTAKCDRETVLRCHSLSPVAYIIRPYKASFLKSEIGRVLGNRNWE